MYIELKVGLHLTFAGGIHSISLTDQSLGASFREILKSSSRYLSRSGFLLVPFSVVNLVKSVPFYIP